MSIDSAMILSLSLIHISVTERGVLPALVTTNNDKIVDRLDFFDQYDLMDDCQMGLSLKAIEDVYKRQIVGFHREPGNVCI